MLDLVRSYWAALTPEMQTAIVGALATVVSATLGVMAVLWQIGRQGRQALLQNRHTEKLKLKLHVYEQIVKFCADATDKDVAFYSYVQKFVSDLSRYKHGVEGGYSPRLPETRWLTMNERQSVLSKAVIKLVIVTEQWGILHPGLEVVRMALNSALHDVSDTYIRYMDQVARHIPLDDQQQGTLFPWVCPTDAEAEQIKVMSNELGERIFDVGSYVHDFQVEMQNLLLGELFDNRLPARSPLDPRSVVLRLSEYQKQRKFFEEETAWGKQKQEFDRAWLAETAPKAE